MSNRVQIRYFVFMSFYSIFVALLADHYVYFTASLNLRPSASTATRVVTAAHKGIRFLGCVAPL